MTEAIAAAPADPPTAAVVDLAAISANVATLRRRTTAALMAVVKADAYGHGLVPAARAALGGGAPRLATAFVDEALALRAAGVDVPILALILRSGESRLGAAIAADVEVSVGGPAALDAVLAAVRTSGVAAAIHLEVDTGLSRGGARADGWAAIVDSAARAVAEGAVRVVGVWSHLACADQPEHPANAMQLAAYRDALDTARRHGVVPQIRHLANSGGLLALPDTHFDAVRAGIAVYGLAPGPAVPAAGLTPAMTLVSRLALTKEVPAGAGVSYGLTHRTASATRLAVIPVGYGDGVPRQASNRAEVCIDGVRHPIVGRVCMDQFVVDTGDHVVDTGDPVVLFGPGRAGEPTADDWAGATGTIGYEIVTRIGARVPRVYHGGGTG
ncbi:MAG: alanine racemase [Mycobacteriales bacterium]